MSEPGRLDLLCVDIVLQGISVDAPTVLVVPVGRPWAFRELILVKVLLLFFIFLFILLIILLFLLVIPLQSAVLPHWRQRGQVLVVEQGCPTVTSAHAPLAGVALWGQRRWAMSMRV